MLAVLRRGGIAPVLLPRLAGWYPGYVFTNPPISLAAGHYGLGHGSGAHAPDEYFVIEPSNPLVSSWDGAVASHVAYLYELAQISAGSPRGRRKSGRARNQTPRRLCSDSCARS